MLCRSSHGRWRWCLMHYRRRWRRGLMLHRRRLRRRRVHIMFRRPLRSRRKSLLRRIVLPFRLRRRWRALIIRAPYWFRRRLMIVTSAIEIASTIAASRLLVHNLRIAVAIHSSPIVVHVRLGLRWRIVRPRHSRYVIVSVGALLVSVSTGTAERMLISIAVSNPASNGTTASSHRSTGHRRWFVMISVWPTIDNSLVCRRKRRMEARRRIHQPRSAIPSAPAARSPAPAASVDKYPPAVPIGHPSPRIRRNPCISKAGRIAPIAVAERVPVVTNIIRLPDFAISRDVIVLAVIIQVACAVLVR